MSLKESLEYASAVLKVLEENKDPNICGTLKIGLTNNEFKIDGVIIFDPDTCASVRYYELDSFVFEEIELPPEDCSTEETYFQNSLIYDEKLCDLFCIFWYFKKNFHDSRGFYVYAKEVHCDISL